MSVVIDKNCVKCYGGGEYCKTVKSSKISAGLCALFLALVLFCTFLCTTFISCAGGAGSPNGAGAEGTALAIMLPDFSANGSRTLYEKEEIVSFTVTISQGSYKNTKSANKGEIMLFSNIPVGLYSVIAYGKTASGAVGAKCESSVQIVEGETTTTTLTLHRLDWYTVKFFADGIELSSAKVTDGYTATKPGNPTPADGHSFGYWSASAPTTDVPKPSPFSFNTPITSDTNLYAVWDATPYTITYVSAPKAVTADTYTTDAEFTLPTPAKDGLSFAGWYAEEDFSGTRVYSLSEGNSGNVTYYAKWTATVTFDSQGGSAVTPQTVVYNGKATAPATPANSGLSLVGWYTSSDGGTSFSDTAYDFDTEITENITLYAKWGLDINGLGDYLEGLPTGSKESPNVIPPIVGLSTGNWNNIKILLQANDTKFVDLSATTLPDGITIMYESFKECTSLVAAPVIPESVTDMRRCFYGCTSLTTAPVIPNSVTKMGECFMNCASLTSAPVIPNSVTGMACCFEECTSLTTAPAIPDSVTDMSSCFRECTSLTTAPAIPDSVTDMTNCFYSCTSLTTAPAIPDSVTIMTNCFYSCTNLAGNIVVNASITGAFYWTDTFYDCTYSGITVYVPDEGTEAALRAKYPASTGLSVQVGQP